MGFNLKSEYQPQGDQQQAIDALQISAVVQPAATGGDRYLLTTRLEGVFTAELIRRLASEAKCTGLEEGSG